MIKNDVIKKISILSLTLPLLNSLLYADPIIETENQRETIWTQSYLLGDGKGFRQNLVDNGLSFNLEYTSIYQGSDAGSDDTFKYSGKVDAFINLDSGKLGLWEGGGFRTHFEYGHGNGASFLGGTLFPVNVMQLTPLGSHEKVVATSLYLTQKFGEKYTLMLGKINAIDLLASNPFFGGWGTQRFMHLAFVAPPSGLVPPVIMGGILSIQTKPVSWTIMVFDPEDRTNSYNLKGMFDDGINTSVTGNYATTMSGRKTSFSMTATYSTKNGPDLSIYPSDLATTTEDGSYNVGIQLMHNLKETDEGAWGTYLRVAIADGNPNTIQNSLVGGIGGQALFFDRPQDHFGLGYYYYNFSDYLKNTGDPSIDIPKEYGMEIFYNLEITPWLHITGDIQYVNPADTQYKEDVVVGLRSNIKF